MMPEDKVGKAKHRIDQWIADKVENTQEAEVLQEAPGIQ